MTTHTIDTTNSAGCSPCTPEAHQRAGVTDGVKQMICEEQSKNMNRIRNEIGLAMYTLKELDGEQYAEARDLLNKAQKLIYAAQVIID